MGTKQGGVAGPHKSTIAIMFSGVFGLTTVDKLAPVVLVEGFFFVLFLTFFDDVGRTSLDATFRRLLLVFGGVISGRETKI